MQVCGKIYVVGTLSDVKQPLQAFPIRQESLDIMMSSDQVAESKYLTNVVLFSERLNNFHAISLIWSRHRLCGPPRYIYNTTFTGSGQDV